MVIWLLGISGSGKTTLGLMLKKYFEEKGRKPYLIDGDIVRNFYDNDLGYSKEDRIANIKRIFLAVHVLSENDVLTIVCNIFPFEFLREFAREKIKNYNQIYLKCSIDKCREKDIKGVYKDNIGKTDIIGIDCEFEEPESSDLILETDKETEQESFDKIINYLKNKMTKP